LPLNLTDPSGDLIHVFARPEQHGLRKPNGFFAELVIDRAVVVLNPLGELAIRIDGAVGARIEGLLEERLLVERRVTAGAWNALARNALRNCARGKSAN
jgi:hypothetical protein